MVFLPSVGVFKLVVALQKPADACGAIEQRRNGFVEIERGKHFCDKFRHIDKLEPRPCEQVGGYICQVCGIQLGKLSFFIKLVELFESFSKEGKRSCGINGGDILLLHLVYDLDDRRRRLSYRL